MNVVSNFAGDMDLFPAGMSERPHQDGLLGKTFSCIVGRQFRSLRQGDRFFFTNRDLPSEFEKENLSLMEGAP